MIKIASFVQLALVASVALVAACGSSGPSRPGPLKYTLEEKFIARIAPADRPQVTQAKVDYDTATSEALHAQDNLREAETDAQLAQNERDQANLNEKTAQLKIKNAEQTGDLTRINAAKSEFETVRLGTAAANAKYEYARAKVEAAKKKELWSAHNLYWRQAQLELEKGKVAKANNIQPAGFAIGNFESQAKARKEGTDRAKADADRAAQAAADKENAWKQADRAWNAARGIKVEGE